MSNDNNKYDPDAALARARAALNKDSADDKNGIKAGWLNRIFNPVSSFGIKALQTAIYAKDKFIMPVARFFQPAAKGYVNLFSRVVHKTDPETGKRTFKPLRAIGMTAASAAVAAGMITQVVPFTADLVYDGVFMTTTMKEETVFMNGSHPMDEAGKQFYARSCSQLPCESDNNSNYYMLRDNTYLDVSYLATKGRTYLPELVQSAIPDGYSVCKISSYGVRWRFPRTYRNLIEAECRPLTQDEASALQRGETLRPYFTDAENGSLTQPAIAAPAAPANTTAPALAPAG